MFKPGPFWGEIANGTINKACDYRMRVKTGSGQTDTLNEGGLVRS